MLGRYHDHAQSDARGFHDVRQVIERSDENALDRLPHLRGIGIEGGVDREVLPAKPAVAKQRLTEVAHTDHHHRPRLVRTEDVPHCPDQFIAAVADTGIAELTKEAEVFADLGIAEAEQGAQLAG